MTSSPKTIVILTRIPQLGHGKTRLQDFLTEQERYQIIKQLLISTVQVCEDVADHLIIAYEGTEKDPKVLQQFTSKKCSTTYIPQQPGDLGERMYHALCEGGTDTVLVGSDLINLSTSHLNEAFNQLNQGIDVALGPAEDGGFGLIGMRKPRNLFSEMTWSHRHVCHHLCQRITRSNLTYTFTDMLVDIDTKEDLIRYETGAQICSWITTTYGSYIRLSNNMMAYIPNADSTYHIYDVLGPRAKMVDTRLLPRPLAIAPIESCPIHPIYHDQRS